MAKFEKMSFWYMLGMTLVTFNLYPLAWMVDTTRRLRAAGGKVPSLYFYFAPLILMVAGLFAMVIINGFDAAKSADMINKHPLYITGLRNLLSIATLYFWFGYVRSYFQIVQHKKDTKSIVIYLVLIALFLEGKFALLISYVIDYFKIHLNFFAPLSTMALEYPAVAGLAGYAIGAILYNIALFFLFQRGYNSFVE